MDEPDGSLWIFFKGSQSKHWSHQWVKELNTPVTAVTANYLMINRLVPRNRYIDLFNSLDEADEVDRPFQEPSYGCN